MFLEVRMAIARQPTPLSNFFSRPLALRSHYPELRSDVRPSAPSQNLDCRATASTLDVKEINAPFGQSLGTFSAIALRRILPRLQTTFLLVLKEEQFSSRLQKL